LDQTDYKVQLDIYSGPLDLLLYLIKKNEIDIYDIPIAEITEQYCAYLDLFQKLDLNVAGEFLVMAATLMLIKSRMLLPKEELGAEEEEDPRLALVQQLMEYKRFKEAACELSERAELQMQKFAPSFRYEGTEDDNGNGEILKEVDLWDIVSAFKKVLDDTGAAFAETIIKDDIPIQMYCRRVLARLASGKLVSFFDLFSDKKEKGEFIGTFLAILELARAGEIIIEQNKLFGDIYLRLADKEAA